jgi:hypothetical protein
MDMGSCDVDLKAFAATMSWCPFSNLHSDPFENQELPKTATFLCLEAFHMELKLVGLDVADFVGHSSETAKFCSECSLTFE